MNAPPEKRNGALLHTPIPKAKLTEATSVRAHVNTRVERLPQVFSRRIAATRRCVSCDSPVTNQSLGGFGGRSALSGPVWCLQCADGISEMGDE